MSMFCCRMSKTAIWKKELLPFGWNFRPSSYWRPVVGSNGEPSKPAPDDGRKDSE
ncbi:hypothetical protein D3C72_2568640 [compost metagenome]